MFGTKFWRITQVLNYGKGQCKSDKTVILNALTGLPGLLTSYMAIDLAEMATHGVQTKF